MSKPKEFKFIKGAYATGLPADICFYTDVDYWSVNDFLWEFDYLVNYISPSKIRIHINSVGGSVIEGMSVFAKISDCPIPTECINDALAASMGSIIWAAGDELYMKDYALLMIHNPFCDIKGDKEYNQATEAFTQQLKTIYTKRFGLSEEEVENIMNGKEGEDGTFLTASQALEKGFITEENIIETPRVIKDQIQAALHGSKDIAQIRAVYGLLSSPQASSTITKENNKPKSQTMEKDKLTVIAALFGLSEEKATTENVVAQINELKLTSARVDNLTKDLNDAKAELTKTKAELTGAQTSIKNLTDDLNAKNDLLKKYQDAEATAKENKVKALIDKAIAECKINKDEREAYIKMAQDNFELAENVLAKIPARDNLGNIIGKSNATDAKDGMKTEEERVFDKVSAIVGSDFSFKKLK